MWTIFLLLRIWRAPIASIISQECLLIHHTGADSFKNQIHVISMHLIKNWLVLSTGIYRGVCNHVFLCIHLCTCVWISEIYHYCKQFMDHVSLDQIPLQWDVWGKSVFQIQFSNMHSKTKCCGDKSNNGGNKVEMKISRTFQHMVRYFLSPIDCGD